MRPIHKEHLKEAGSSSNRHKKSRGRKRVRIQARVKSGVTVYSWMRDYADDWKNWWGKYLTVKDARQAVISMSQGSGWRDCLDFRVHPEDETKYG